MSELGVAICTYNRGNQLGEVLEHVIASVPDAARVVVADDGSTDDTSFVVDRFKDRVIYVRGKNRGVAHNKNRGLVGLIGCDYLAILEDDLVPRQSGWLEHYAAAAEFTGVHHFCRVQDKEVPETMPDFNRACVAKGFTPIYGPSPRGDLTFLTARVVDEVGAFNPEFIGVGYAHGEWSNRVGLAGLIPHPLKWMDIKECRDVFEQLGDTAGGRWNAPPAEIEEQKKCNRAVYRRLKAAQYVYCPLTLS